MPLSTCSIQSLSIPSANVVAFSGMTFLSEKRRKQGKKFFEKLMANACNYKNSNYLPFFLVKYKNTVYFHTLFFFPNVFRHSCSCCVSIHTLSYVYEFYGNLLFERTRNNVTLRYCSYQTARSNRISSTLKTGSATMKNSEDQTPEVSTFIHTCAKDFSRSECQLTWARVDSPSLGITKYIYQREIAYKRK